MSIKIAAVTDDGKTISQHFGRAKYYTVLTIENGQITAREQREKMGHAHFAGEEHAEEKDPRGHGFAPAEQDRHFRMTEAIRDCQILLARGMARARITAWSRSASAPSSPTSPALTKPLSRPPRVQL